MTIEDKHIWRSLHLPSSGGVIVGWKNGGVVLNDDEELKITFKDGVFKVVLMEEEAPWYSRLLDYLATGWENHHGSRYQ